MTDAPELLPCPFCGGNVRSQSTITDAAVWCTGCGAKVVRLHYLGTNADWNAMPRVVAAWNRRATPAALAAAPEAQAMIREAEARGVRVKAETLAKEIQAIVAADRWKGRALDAEPPEKWHRLRPETQQFWIDEATRIIRRLDNE